MGDVLLEQRFNLTDIHPERYLYNFKTTILFADISLVIPSYDVNHPSKSLLRDSLTRQLTRQQFIPFPDIINNILMIETSSETWYF